MSKKKKSLVRVIDGALSETEVSRARRAIARLGRERLRESYFTTFWLARGERPQNAVEEAVAALRDRAGVRCTGVEWWIGRTFRSMVLSERKARSTLASDL